MEDEQTLAAGNVNIDGASARRIPRDVRLVQDSPTAIEHRRSGFVRKEICAKALRNGDAASNELAFARCQSPKCTISRSD